MQFFTIPVLFKAIDDVIEDNLRDMSISYAYQKTLYGHSYVLYTNSENVLHLLQDLDS